MRKPYWLLTLFRQIKHTLLYIFKVDKKYFFVALILLIFALALYLVASAPAVSPLVYPLL